MDRIDTRHLFSKLDEQLMVLLRSLSAADWNKPTAAKRWRVKDVAAHLLDGNLRTLSMLRDGYTGVQPRDLSYDGLVAYLNELNAGWVTAYQRISPPILIQQLEQSAREYNQYLSTLDLDAKAAFPVAWAGEDESKNWFHIAREYTEKWHHQMQLREAVSAPFLLSAEWYAPVLQTFMRALPHAYRKVHARDGATVKVVIDGDAGGAWRIEKMANQWEFSESVGMATATVNLPSQDAWKVFTKGLPFEVAIHRARIEGDCNLGEHVLRMVTVMA
ncbi:MAG: maleylpyruvate isomerase N-terminal domain-containing protein [Cytophagales bacterium]